MFVGVPAGRATAALVPLAASVVREGPSCRKGNALPDINALCACNPLPALRPHLRQLRAWCRGQAAVELRSGQRTFPR